MDGRRDFHFTHFNTLKIKDVSDNSHSPTEAFSSFSPVSIFCSSDSEEEFDLENVNGYCSEEELGELDENVIYQDDRGIEDRSDLGGIVDVFNGLKFSSHKDNWAYCKMRDHVNESKAQENVGKRSFFDASEMNEKNKRTRVGSDENKSNAYSLG